MLTIDAKVLGRKKPLFNDWSIPLPPDLGGDGEPLTLRVLITRIVLEEVKAFRERQEERKVLKALTAAQIDAGLAKGKVDMGGRDLKQEVDEDQAVSAALQAFEDGIYLVVLDGEEERDLDKEIHLHEDSRITFVRLAMLSGG
ncbi:MAG: hypothetical protein L0Y72_30365 [Gemmataceae bacterium]|nr:hypothetical protein [Gemmataceae bacterium]MCI0743352.1 hypothetical protein [Gemmataceae bacterium]